MLRDTSLGYGLVSRVLHWLMALAIFGLFGLGFWMTGLDYYSPYYHSAPDLHKSIGMVVLAALIVRVLWRFHNVRPDDGELTVFERRAARAVHTSFYVFLFLIMASGYLVATADGRAIEIFGVLPVPSVFEDKGIEDGAGRVHEILAYVVMALAFVHAAAAVKHHLVDRKPTLTRMWSGPPKSSTQR